MSKLASHRKSIAHTLVNIGLSAFLIIIATIGIYSLNNAAGAISSNALTHERSSLEKVMVCSIGQCNLA